MSTLKDAFQEQKLLMLAAKAAGYDDAIYLGGDWMFEEHHGMRWAVWSAKLEHERGSGYWNPLVRDRDAQELKDKLKLTRKRSRLSIVRAAAEIGKDKKGG